MNVFGRERFFFGCFCIMFCGYGFEFVGFCGVLFVEFFCFCFFKCCLVKNGLGGNSGYMFFFFDDWILVLFIKLFIFCLVIFFIFV